MIQNARKNLKNKSAPLHQHCTKSTQWGGRVCWYWYWSISLLNEIGSKGEGISSIGSFSGILNHIYSNYRKKPKENSKKVDIVSGRY